MKIKLCEGLISFAGEENSLGSVELVVCRIESGLDLVRDLVGEGKSCHTKTTESYEGDHETVAHGCLLNIFKILALALGNVIFS
jgi:hypothetical protein